MTTLLHLDLFSGIGGLSLAAEAAGFPTVAFCERDPFCRRVLAHHWPGVPCYDDIHAVTADRLRRDGIGPVGIVSGGFPCFAAGTLVLTYRGYLPIESVEVGDRVLTHAGRWMSVTETMRRHAASTRVVRVSGSEIVTTDEHPFFTRFQGRHWNNQKRQYERTFAPPEWVPADGLTTDHRVGQVVPTGGSEYRTPEFWWLVGRYLADGWTARRYGRKSGGRTIICCAHGESDLLAGKIRAAGYAATAVMERTSTRFHITNVELYEFLRGSFGRYAHGKVLPGFALELDDARSSALLEGYLSGDGYTEERQPGVIEHKITTVSEALAYSVALLAQRVFGTVAGVRRCKMARTTSIEGRIVNQRDFFVVRIPVHNRVSFVEGNYAWKPVRSSVPGGPAEVFNLAVDGDESYVVNGVIVHNCQPFSVAGQRGGAGDERYLWPEMLRVVGECRPRWMVGENVSGLRSIDAGRVFGTILADLAGIGYRAGWISLRAAEVGAPHRRERIFIVAYAGDGGHQGRDAGRGGGPGERAPTGDAGATAEQSGGGVALADPDGGQRGAGGAWSGQRPMADRHGPGPGRADAGGGGAVAHAASGRRHGQPERRAGHDGGGQDGRRTEVFDVAGERPARPDWPAEPGLRGGPDGVPAGLDGRRRWPVGPGQVQHAWEPPRTVDGRVPDRLDRLRALGNAVVPAQASPIFAAIAAACSREGETDGE